MEDNIWTVGKAISMNFTVNGDYSKFNHIEIDDSYMYSNGYTIESDDDGTVIKIPANYLDNYAAVGEHTLAVKYEDGEAIAAFTVQLEKLPPLEGHYEYPFTPEDEEWAELSLGEKRKACSIAQNVLDSMTDEQLAQAILEFPFLCDINLYGTKEYAATVIAQTSDAYAELLKRGTGKDALISKMKEIAEDEKVENVKKSNLFDLIDGEESFEREFTDEDRAYIEEIRSLYD